MLINHPCCVWIFWVPRRCIHHGGAPYIDRRTRFGVAQATIRYDNYCIKEDYSDSGCHGSAPSQLRSRRTSYPFGLYLPYPLRALGPLFYFQVPRLLNASPRFQSAPHTGVREKTRTPKFTPRAYFRVNPIPWVPWGGLENLRAPRPQNASPQGVLAQACLASQGARWMAGKSFPSDVGRFLMPGSMKPLRR